LDLNLNLSFSDPCKNETSSECFKAKGFGGFGESPKENYSTVNSGSINSSSKQLIITTVTLTSTSNT